MLAEMLSCDAGVSGWETLDSPSSWLMTNFFRGHALMRETEDSDMAYIVLLYEKVDLVDYAKDHQYDLL